MSLENKPSQITIDYNGNLANRISWQEGTLVRFAKVADLRTRVTIKDSDANSQFSTESLGEVLIGKSFANPLDFFARQTSLGGKLRVATNFEVGEATIYLNHHIITQDVVQRCKGRIDERLFTEQVNFLVKKGLGNVLAQEKQKQVLSSLLIDGKYLAKIGLDIGILGGLSYGFFVYQPFSHLSEVLFPPKEMTGESFRDFLSTVENTIYPLLGNIFDITMGFDAFLPMRTELLKSTRRFYKEGGNDNYIKSYKDLNPISHAKSYVAGRIYLATKGKELATLITQ